MGPTTFGPVCQWLKVRPSTTVVDSAGSDWCGGERINIIAKIPSLVVVLSLAFSTDTSELNGAENKKQSSPFSLFYHFSNPRWSITSPMPMECLRKGKLEELLPTRDVHHCTSNPRQIGN